MILPVPALSRASTAYKTDASMVASGLPRYEAGKVGQGMMIEEGTSPLFLNSSFENSPDFENWTNSQGIGGSAWVIATDAAFHGAKSARLDGTGSHLWQGKQQVVSFPVAGQTYTAQARFKNSAGITYPGHLRIRKSTDGISWTVVRDVTASSTSWIFASGSYTVESGINYVLAEFYSSTGNAIGQSVWCDCFQMENKNYATSWQLSGSDRLAESLSFDPSQVLLPSQGTWNQWVNVNSVSKRQVSTHFPRVFSLLRGAGQEGITLRHKDASANWTFYTENDSGNTGTDVADSYTADGWHMFTVDWMPAAAHLYIDNVLWATIDTPKLPASFYSAFIGSFDGSAAGSFINAVVDKVSCWRRVITAAERAAIYADPETAIAYGPDYSLSFNGTLLPDGFTVPEDRRIFTLDRDRRIFTLDRDRRILK